MVEKEEQDSRGKRIGGRDALPRSAAEIRGVVRSVIERQLTEIEDKAIKEGVVPDWGTLTITVRPEDLYRKYLVVDAHVKGWLN